VLVSLAAVATATSQVGDGPSGTTLDQRIIAGGSVFSDDYSGLKLGPGEPHSVRQDGIGTASDGRNSRRRSLLYFGQLTDIHVVDEESPARVEALDPFASPAPFGSAWRPQESLTGQVGESAVQQFNKFTDASPVAAGNGSRAKMKFAVTTGDSIDNQQLNETQALVKLLEGSTPLDPLDPNSGSSDSAAAAGSVGCTGVDTSDAPNYTGVQD